VVFEDLYWMQKVSIILAIVVVNSVIVVEFIISAAPSTWLVRQTGSCVFWQREKFLYFITKL